MNKLFSFLLLLLFLLIGYTVFDFQTTGIQKLRSEIEKERLLRGQFYCLQLIRDLETYPQLDEPFLRAIQHITSLQPNEIINITLKVDQEYMTLWELPGVQKNLSDQSNICIKSQDFKYRNATCNIFVYLQSSIVTTNLHYIQILQEKLTILLVTLVFLTTLFLLYLFYQRSMKEKSRIQAEMRQQKISNQLELHKHEKTTSEMRQLIQAQEQQLRHADKMNSLGTLASGMAHEINNPNSYIALNAETLEKAWRDVLEIINRQIDDETKIAGIPYKIMRERIPALTQAIKEGSTRIQNITADLKHFASAQKSHERKKEPINIKAVLESSLRLTNYFILKHTHHLIVENHLDLWIQGYHQRLEQVFVNLLINAAQALETRDKKIQVKTFSQDQNAYIEIKDEGCGISEENLKKIFEPFFTTKGDSEGTGLGLSISYSMIQEVTGEILVESQLGQGTTFTVILPTITSNSTNTEGI